MADISLAEMNEALTSGAGDFLVDAANAARRGVCRAFRGAPAAIVGSPLDNAAARAWQGLAERLCNPLPEPLPEPSDPVPGGQCAGRAYQITYRYRNTPSDSWITASPITRNGAIGGIVLKRTSETAMQITLFHSGGGSGGSGVEEPLGFVSGESGSVGSAEMLSVTPVDGLPDDCGDVPPNYPIQPADAGDLDYLDTIPVGGKPTQFPITINPVKVDVGIQVKPEFNVNIGGIQVNLDITGAKITISPTLNINPVLPPALDPRPEPPPAVQPPQDPGQADEDIGDALESLAEAIEEVKEISEAAKTCACEEEPEVSLVPDLLGSGASGDYLLPEGTRFVRVSLSTQPSNPRRQNGLSAPDVLYAGWAWYKYLNGCSERLPLDSAEKSYPVETEVVPTRFAFTCNTGFSAVATAYKEVET